MKINSLFFVFVGVLVLSSCREQNKNDGEVVMQDDYEFTNDLINETSPYLLQHAHNPVDWKAWSDDAFKKAADENKLVVLSVGYSTCHWCHVMEEESFEDAEVAKLMNDKFVSIKVDREERPDLDMVYQTALQLVNGKGGWPMNAIIMPNGSPVFLGTYHEKENWKNILAKFSTEYEKNPDKMKEYATMLADGVQEVYEQPTKQMANAITPNKMENGIIQWSTMWDKDWGGNIGQQKFILPANLTMLLDYAVLQQNLEAKNHVLNTLDKVVQGGIYDHVDGGFFRYSTDNTWKVPHFEKMLYDNAQLVSLLSKAYKLTGNEVYKIGVSETLAFLKSEMRNEDGGYFSAMDADTNGEEGVYYVWKKQELEALLKDDFKLFSLYFNIIDDQVWEQGNYVLNNTLPKNNFLKKTDLTTAEFEKKMASWKSVLYEARQKRQKPTKDYKILTSWNALLIDGLLEAYKAFGDDQYLDEAISVFRYLNRYNYKNEQLVHSYTKDSKQKEVFLEDYAFLAKSAFSLFEVTLDTDYLTVSKELMNTASEKYKSNSELFYYNVSNDLVPSIINTSDGVVPSANAIMAQNYLRIGHLEYNKDFLKKAEVMGSFITSDFENHAVSYGAWGTLLLAQAYPFYEIVIVGKDAEKLMNEIHKTSIVNSLIVGSSVESDISLFKDRYTEDDTFIYVCQDNTCKLPVKTVNDSFEQMINFGYQGFN
ncbi:thioredoxin domain-containing protein [Maribacter sp. SA7]|uniref:thioredoxin domain-containing protein n=1 Tax=Maribacter zhoushanensis TaxID=3030012 RepID=UPI0023EDA308|nr:thioredoxin domain-containing protein [Maribacter zhoushanensis]MDF4203361.1 thioredoxin domain-containing protein [Maribacter zhoushanensis]